MFTEGDTGKMVFFRSFFLHVLEIAQPNCTRKDILLLTVQYALFPEIDRAFVYFPMAEACDFHCYSYVSDNLGERSIPSDLVAIRVVVQKPTIRCVQVKRIPSWMSKRPVSSLF